MARTFAARRRVGVASEKARERRIAAQSGLSASATLEVRVVCYAGHRGEETPRRLAFGGRIIEVIEVLDAWLAPDHRYFKVSGDDGACYILRNDVMTGRWELTMFDRIGAIR